MHRTLSSICYLRLLLKSNPRWKLKTTEFIFQWQWDRRLSAICTASYERFRKMTTSYQGISKLSEITWNSSSNWTQPRCCLAFSGIELQMLFRCCLIHTTIIIRRSILYPVYMCPCLCLGLFMLYICDLFFIFHFPCFYFNYS